MKQIIFIFRDCAPSPSLISRRLRSVPLPTDTISRIPIMEKTNGLPEPTPSSDRIKLNVGGRVFETTVSTLQSAGPDSLLYALSTTSTSATAPIFVDRDPEVFAVLLSLLRIRRLPSFPTFSRHHLSDEALYFGLDSLLSSATSPPPLSGVDSSLSSTLLPPIHPCLSSLSFCSHDSSSSLLVAHGGLISCYDSNLVLSSTTPTHFPDITSILGVGSDIAAVGSDSSAGLHFYSLSSSRHVGSSHWSDPSDPRIYKACITALANNAACSVFASFECPHKENAIFSIDKETLAIVSEFGRQPGNSAKNMAPGKLIWLPERGVVVGSSVNCGAFGYSGYIRLWDPRSGEVVWETNEPGSGRSSRFGDSFADVDADAEDSRLFKVCSKSGDLGVADLRKLGEDPWVYLKEKNPSMRNVQFEGNNVGSSVIHCYRKQVFMGREGNLEVWSRVEGVDDGDGEVREEGMYRMNYMDKEEDAERGVINKIEGGGDRLFVSREGVEGIEVWETSNFVTAVSVL